MQSNARVEIAKLLNEEISEPEAAALLAALAFEWWAQETSRVGGDRVELLEALAAIKTALAQINPILDTGIAYAKEKAQAGNTLQQKLAEGETALAKNQIEIENLHAELEPRLVEEKALRKQAAQIAGLNAQLEELQHLQALAGHAAELRAQVDEMDQHLPPGSLEAGQLEKALAQASQKMIRLQETALQNLREGIRQSLEKCSQREAEIRQAALDLKSARERYRLADEALTPAHRETLRLYLAADLSIASVLPNARRIEDLVVDIERKLGEADLALKYAIEANEKEKTLLPLPFKSSAG